MAGEDRRILETTSSSVTFQNVTQSVFPICTVHGTHMWSSLPCHTSHHAFLSIYLSFPLSPLGRCSMSSSQSCFVMSISYSKISSATSKFRKSYAMYSNDLGKSCSELRGDRYTPLMSTACTVLYSNRSRTSDML